MWLALRTGRAHNLQANSQLTIHGFSAGSLNGLALHCITRECAPAFQRTTNVGALACTVDLIKEHCESQTRTLRISHFQDDQLCVWHPEQEDLRWLRKKGVQVTYIVHGDEDQKEVDWVGKHKHGYGHLAGMEMEPGLFKWQKLETTISGVTPCTILDHGNYLLGACWIPLPISRIF